MAFKFSFCFGFWVVFRLLAFHGFCLCGCLYYKIRGLLNQCYLRRKLSLLNFRLIDISRAELLLLMHCLIQFLFVCIFKDIIQVQRWLCCSKCSSFPKLLCFLLRSSIVAVALIFCFFSLIFCILALERFVNKVEHGF